MKPIFTDTKDFDHAVDLFMAYQPVKVKRELREDFDRAISSRCIKENINRWSYTTYPQVKAYKFLRT